MSITGSLMSASSLAHGLTAKQHSSVGRLRLCEHDKSTRSSGLFFLQGCCNLRTYCMGHLGHDVLGEQGTCVHVCMAHVSITSCNIKVLSHTCLLGARQVCIDFCANVDVCSTASLGET